MFDSRIDYKLSSEKKMEIKIENSRFRTKLIGRIMILQKEAWDFSTAQLDSNSTKSLFSSWKDRKSLNMHS